MAASFKGILVTLSLLSLLTPHLAITCKSKTTTFENCNDLPTLNALLHWTYDPSESSLSMAFTASPLSPDGWVAWALNPMGSGMERAQALIAFKPTTGGPVTGSTYDIQSYYDLVKGPISYNVTGLSAEESDGEITIFATWALPMGKLEVNQVWQVGQVVNGKPRKHEFQQPNLESKMKLSLVNGPTNAPAGPPDVDPAPLFGGDVAGAFAPGPAKSVAVGSYGMAALILVLGALLVSLF